MSAPSDGARGDARKRLAAAEVVPVDERIVAVLNDVIVDDPMWIGDDGEPLDYLPEREALIGDFLYAAATALAGVIADAKAEAWDERDRARATYPDPHPEDCAGWEDCWCASYPNPYRVVTS